MVVAVEERRRQRGGGPLATEGQNMAASEPASDKRRGAARHALPSQRCSRWRIEQ